MRRLQRELRAEQRAQARQQQAARRLDQLQQKAQAGRLTALERRELRRLQRAQRLQLRQQQVRDRGPEDRRAAARALRSPRVSPDQAVRGRFASAIRHRPDDRARWRANRQARLAARAAWRLGLLAGHVPWYGPVYWPYAYTDVFFFTFWPEAYDPAYWAFVYDDFFDGIFFPYGAPYVDYAYVGPYGPRYGGTTGAAPRRELPGRMSPTVRQLCTDPGHGITAWPFEQIEQAVQPNAEQKRLLEDLKTAAADAAAAFREACPEVVPMTPPGRLEAMTRRLTATLDAVKRVRPAMQAFYESLSDEQQARLNEIAPEPARGRRRAGADRTQQEAVADCSSEKAGLSNLAVERIEEAVSPTDAQYAALDRLSEAMQKAVDILREACPSVTPLTPVGRLETMQARLQAMIDAANAVRPALNDFYAGLSSEQKAKFNRLGRESARSGG